MTLPVAGDMESTGTYSATGSATPPPPNAPAHSLRPPAGPSPDLLFPWLTSCRIPLADHNPPPFRCLTHSLPLHLWSLGQQTSKWTTGVRASMQRLLRSKKARVVLGSHILEPEFPPQLVSFRHCRSDAAEPLPPTTRQHTVTWNSDRSYSGKCGSGGMPQFRPQVCSLLRPGLAPCSVISAILRSSTLRRTLHVGFNTLRWTETFKFYE